MGGSRQRDTLTASYAALADGLAERAGLGGSCPRCREDLVRVGTDVQEVAAVRAALEEHGDRYLARVFTPAEVADSRSQDAAWTEAGVASLAGRYAAKEAAIKALRPVHTGIPWDQIEVVRENGGWCRLDLHAAASRLAAEAGVVSWALSFSHDGGVAVATVIGRHGCAPVAGPGAPNKGE